MVAIDDADHTLKIESLTSALRHALPPYACPVFLRLMDQIPTTSMPLTLASLLLIFLLIGTAVCR